MPNLHPSSRPDAAPDMAWNTAAEIAASVADGGMTATAVVDQALARIAKLNPALNAFTAMTAERARSRAKVIDSIRDRSALPLAGVPFAVKNFFDVAGIVTTAGSKINRSHAPADRDCPLIEQLEAAGAFWSARSTWVNTPTTSPGERARRPLAQSARRNADDRRLFRRFRWCGCGRHGAICTRLRHQWLDSVPSSLCGIFGLKPTYGRLHARAHFRLYPV